MKIFLQTLALSVCFLSVAGVSAQEYTVTFFTADKFKAGTDMDVYLTLHDQNGSTTEVRANKLISYNAFEQGKTDTIEFTDAKAINPTSLSLRCIRVADVKDDWMIDKVKVTMKTIETTKSGREFLVSEEKTFGMSQWIGAGTTTISTTANYDVQIQTGTSSGAGTDANITIKIHGTAGRTTGKVLNPLISGNAFENGDLDRVSFAAENVGEITGIEIISDDAYPGSAWNPTSFKVSKDGGKALTWGYEKTIDGDNMHVELGKQFTGK